MGLKLVDGKLGAAKQPDDKHGKVSGKKRVEGAVRIEIKPPIATPSQMENNRLLQVHNAKAKIVRWMGDNEHKCLSLLSMIETDMVQDSNLASQLSDEVTTDRFHPTYVHFARLPKYWMAYLLAKEEPEFFTPAVLDRIEKFDKDGIRSLFYLKHGIHDVTRWPAEIKHKVAWRCSSRSGRRS